MMKPILFNTEMVRALLAGRKTVTRRVVEPQPVFQEGETGTPVRCDDGSWCFKIDQYNEVYDSKLKHPYHTDDILYVRETWTMISDWVDIDPEVVDQISGYIYRADWADGTEHPRWRPSIHMPKEAARLFLRVTNVRVERLQDITEEQAIAEGCNGIFAGTGEGMGDGWVTTPCDEFAALWNRTIKKADLPFYGWAANPWVWVIEFERISKEEAVKGGEAA